MQAPCAQRNEAKRQITVPPNSLLGAESTGDRKSGIPNPRQVETSGIDTPPRDHRVTRRDSIHPGETDLGHPSGSDLREQRTAPAKASPTGDQSPTQVRAIFHSNADGGIHNAANPRPQPTRSPAETHTERPDPTNSDCEVPIRPGPPDLTDNAAHPARLGRPDPTPRLAPQASRPTRPTPESTHPGNRPTRQPTHPGNRDTFPADSPTEPERESHSCTRGSPGFNATREHRRSGPHKRQPAARPPTHPERESHSCTWGPRFQRYGRAPTSSGRRRWQPGTTTQLARARSAASVLPRWSPTPRTGTFPQVRVHMTPRWKPLSNPLYSSAHNNNAGWSSSVARWAHNPEVAGSNPVPATTPEGPCPTPRTGAFCYSTLHRHVANSHFARTPRPRTLSVPHVTAGAPKWTDLKCDGFEI